MKKQDENDTKNGTIEENQEEIVKEQDTDEVSEFEQQLTELENNYKRALADYQNLEKRSREERGEWVRSANRELLLRFLPVLDTLLLAQQHAKDQTLQVTAQQFLDVFKAEGVTKIETVGKVFDPHLMEVVEVGEGEDNKVIEEMRAGYLLNDRLLRVAQVKVGQGKKTNL